MLTSKQRAKLRSLASNISATTIVGKDGLTPNVLAQIDRELLAHEIVKVSVLETADVDVKDYLIEAAEKLKAEQVCSIGRKFVLYRYSGKAGVKHLEF